MKQFNRQTTKNRFFVNPFKLIVRSNLTGFTLIELLITILIIVILSSVLFVGQTKEEKKLSLQRAVYGLAQEIRLQQEKALGAEEEVCPMGAKPCGFGLYFLLNSNSYAIFVDCANDCKTSDYKRVSAEDIRTIQLEKDVTICDLTISYLIFSPIATSTLHVVFSPPDPVVYIQGINNKWGYQGTMSFCLNADLSGKKTVKINTAGRIEIEQGE